GADRAAFAGSMTRACTRHHPAPCALRCRAAHRRVSGQVQCSNLKKSRSHIAIRRMSVIRSLPLARSLRLALAQGLRLAQAQGLARAQGVLFREEGPFCKYPATPALQPLLPRGRRERGRRSIQVRKGLIRRSLGLPLVCTFRSLLHWYLHRSSFLLRTRPLALFPVSCTHQWGQTRSSVRHLRSGTG